MRKIICCWPAIAALLVHTVGCGGGEATGTGTYVEMTTGTGGAAATSSSSGTGGSGTGGSRATSTGTGATTAVSTGVSGGSGGSAACITPTNGCGGPDQCGPLLPIVQIMKDVPAPLGGVVEYGTYWITAINEYTGVDSDPLPDDGTAFGGTYLFGAGTLATSTTTVLPGSAPMTFGQTGTFVASGTDFTQSATCGNGSSTATSSYTATGGTLHLYNKNDAGTLELVLVME